MWNVDITKPNLDEITKSTPVCIVAWDGEWTVVESLPFADGKGWEVTALIIDDTPHNPSIEALVEFNSQDLRRNVTDTHTVIFGNQPLIGVVPSQVNPSTVTLLNSVV